MALATMAKEPALKVFEGLLPFMASSASRVSMVVCIGDNHLNYLEPTFSFSFSFNITTYKNCIVRVVFNNYCAYEQQIKHTYNHAYLRKNALTNELIDVHKKQNN